MIYDLRTYYASEGKTDQMIDRFLRQARPIIEALGGKLLATSDERRAEGEFSYMLSFDDEQGRESCWRAFGEDAKWKKIKAESEVEGPLLARSSTQVFQSPE